MKNKHISFIRVVEATTGEKSLNEAEKEHVDNCALCQGRLRASELTEGVLAESKKVIPLVDSEKILKMADKVFDKETSTTILPPFFKILAVAASIVLVLLVAAFAGGGFNEKIENPVKKTAKVKKEVIKEKKKEHKPERFNIGVMEITKGSVFKGERGELKALTDSLITVESESYFIVEKGRVEFSVTNGEDFMVKLNDSALVRVLGTVFTVEVKGKNNSVSVSEGLVELIDLKRGTSKHLAKGESGVVKPFIKRVAKKLKPVKKVVDKKIAKIQTPVENIKKKKKPGKFKFSNDPEMIQAEIRDLEFSLKFSNSPIKELHQLFKLYTKSRRFGSILNFWRSKSSVIQSKGNPFIKEMHFQACKATIELNVYNQICAQFKDSYPNGPFPVRMDYQLNMTK